MGYKSWFIISFSAFGGILVGIYFRFFQPLTSAVVEQSPVHIVCLDCRPPAAILDKIKNQFQTPIEWHSLNSLQLLTSYLQDHPLEADLVLVFHHQIEGLHDQFPLIDLKSLSLASHIYLSTDFAHLTQSSPHGIPISWFIAGFLYSKATWTQPPTSIRNLLERSILLPDNAETSLWILTEGGILEEDWIRQNDQKRLSSALNQWQKQITLRNQLIPEDLSRYHELSILIPHSAAQTLMQGNPDWDFWFPDSKTQLWIRSAGILESSPRIAQTLNLLNQWMSPEANTTWSQGLNEASTLDSRFTPGLMEHLSAKYLRQLPLFHYTVQKPENPVEMLWLQSHQSANWQVLKH
jgi:hypothetical protein